ncbi:flavodoxin [Apibacter adventoris]|uniref:flavodoxin n=1 Tax=Apibacter adventoris TaxID=1679466 RepID=UPI001C883727|nr:flavodoxin [Apibacter adventoris]
MFPRHVRQRLLQITSADIYEIKFETPYTAADLDWTDKKSRSSVEMRDKDFRLAITDREAKIENYDVIYIGFPVWLYIAPTIINTFMESYDFSGKTVILFATSGRSSFRKAVENLRRSCSLMTVIKEGKVFCVRLSEAEIRM